MEVSDVMRLKGLEDETGKLKKLLVDAMLDNAAVKYPLEKKVVQSRIEKLIRWINLSAMARKGGRRSQTPTFRHRTNRL